MEDLVIAVADKGLKVDTQFSASLEKEEYKNVTIMKYKTPDNLYKFKVLDKFDCRDEADRLDEMRLYAKQLEKDGCEILWIKNTAIV